jgi:hypothetical protein
MTVGKWNVGYGEDETDDWGPWEITPLWRRLLLWPNRRRVLIHTPHLQDMIPPFWQYKSARKIAHEFLEENFGGSS